MPLHALDDELSQHVPSNRVTHPGCVSTCVSGHVCSIGDNGTSPKAVVTMILRFVHHPKRKGLLVGYGASELATEGILYSVTANIVFDSVLCIAPASQYTCTLLLEPPTCAPTIED